MFVNTRSVSGDNTPSRKAKLSGRSDVSSCVMCDGVSGYEGSLSNVLWVTRYLLCVIVKISDDGRGENEAGEE